MTDPSMMRSCDCELYDLTVREGESNTIMRPVTTVWFLVGNGGMDYWDYYRGPKGTIIGIYSPTPY